MYLRNSNKYGKNIKISHPGEFPVSRDDEFIGTLLGSCVAVCLIDQQKEIAGMNHFMLPGRIVTADIYQDKTAKYGITAINELLRTMEKFGADKGQLVAKIFGGGSVLENLRDINTIPADNIRLAKVMMEMEDIQITEVDVGGNFTRKVMMEVKTGSVYLKKSTRAEVLDEVSRREMEHVKKIRSKA